MGKREPAQAGNCSALRRPPPPAGTDRLDRFARDECSYPQSRRACTAAAPGLARKRGQGQPGPGRKALIVLPFHFPLLMPDH